MKTIHKELKVNVDTLVAYGKYVDFIQLPEENIRIRIVLIRDLTVETPQTAELTLAPQPPVIGRK